MSEMEITVFPATQKVDREQARKKIRVAAYCRVSTDSEEQANSYRAQKAYYTQLIASNPLWKNAGIYADRGISGTTIKNRDAFNRLLNDCMQGKIDLILTKSLSRFARNTVDCLNTVRMLKAINIGVTFEKENINTLETSGELVITLYSCFAQAESESLSKNVSWGLRKSMEAGNVPMHYKALLGYRKGPDGHPAIAPSEAKIVRMIFRLYAEGCSLAQIQHQLEARGIHAPAGGHRWSRTTLQSILTNERYIGNAVLQKTYTTDCISKTVRKNQGELPIILVENHHAPIISQALFQWVQSEMIRRAHQKRSSKRTKKIGSRKYSGKYALTGRLVCGECGCDYKRVIWTISGKRNVVWRCRSRLEYGKKYCHHSPTVDEAALHRAIVSALNRYIELCRKSSSFSTPQDLLITEDMNYSKHIDQMRDDAEQLRIQEIQDWLKRHPAGVQHYDDQAVRKLITKITVFPSRRISVRFYGKDGVIVVKIK